MSASPRAVAMELLCAWQRSQEPLDRLCEAGLAGHPFADPRDRQLAWSLVMGVARELRYLDWVIAQFSKHPLAKMKPLTLQALRVGAFQLLCLDRVPAAAAINETVAALKAARQPKWLTGFVNGLLRNVHRERQRLETAAPAPAIRYSHPDWLAARWQQRYGEARAAALMRGNNRLPPLTLRVDTAKLTVADGLARLRAAGITAAPGHYSPMAIRLDASKGGVAALPGFEEGWFQVQDEAAQLVSLLVGPFGEGDYLDGCAGLGGKTTHLARLLPPDARLVAVEPSPERLRLLAANLDRLGLAGRVTIQAGELGGLAESRGRFRGVLIDAPCTGLGVIRRHPDIRWHRTATDLARFPKNQLGLLAAAADLIAPDGVLVYATCSMEPEEDGEVVDRFLAAHPDFALSDARSCLPAAAAELVTPRGEFAPPPDRHDLDGFFAARLVRKDG